MNFCLSDKSVYAYFQDNAIIYRDKIAFLSENESYTWAQSFKIYNYLIKMFKDWGITKGKTVAISPMRSIDTPFIIFAALATEALLTLCDPQRMVEEFLGNCSAKIIPDFIIRQNFYGVWVCESKDGKVYTFDKKDGLNFEEKVDVPLTCDEKEPAYIFFTSGSTGKSKAALLTQYAMINNTRIQLLGNGGNSDNKTIVIMPLHHVFGMAILTANLTVGSTLMFPLSREPDYVLDFIDKYRCTRIDAVPTYYYMLIDALKNKHRDINSLTQGIIAGGAYSKQQFEYIEKNLGIVVSPSYGMTETTTVVCFTNADASLQVRSTGIGKLTPVIDGVLKTADGKIAEGAGATGEICVRGYCLMLGYIEPDGSISLPVDEEGYFHTGDLAYRDEEGFLYIVGRCKDIIIRGGENISPLRIQNKIAEMEGVSDVCVLGIPSEKYGEEVGACVVANGVTAEEISEYLKEFLKKYEIPSKYVFVDKLPALAIGKPDKKTIVELFK